MIFKFKKICQNLENQKLIILPTDTVFGVIGKYDDKLVNQKIYDLKKRDHSKKLPVAVNSIAMAQKFFKVNDNALKLMKRYWPGELTIICGDTALRWVKNNLLNKIIARVGPLYLTSANLSGKPPFINKAEAKKTFRDKVACYVGGTINNGISSTIINSYDLKIIRQGNLVIKEVDKNVK